jgi:hypothetical protein
MSKVPSSTSSSDQRDVGALVNRHFTITVVALVLALETFLRLAPSLHPRAFRALYGNSLAMFMTVDERLDRLAGEVRVLALGDSLAMTQFQPDLFAEAIGLADGEVFNGAYLGMSFPSQEDMLRSIGAHRFRHLQHVLYFVNPRRLSASEVPNTDVLRIGIPPAEGSWREAWATKHIGPLLDRSRAYGLSRHLMLAGWRSLLAENASWDHVEYLGPRGGVMWPHARSNGAVPRYPYPPLESVSPARLAEMSRVLTVLRSTGADVTIIASSWHPAVDPFASLEAQRHYEAEVARIGEATGSRYLPGVVSGFHAADERDYCDYGHMDAAGGEAFTRYLASQRRALLRRAVSP